MSFFQCLLVKRDIRAGDEEGIKMKEQAILNLGNMLSKHGKAEGILDFKLLVIVCHRKFPPRSQ